MNFIPQMTGRKLTSTTVCKRYGITIRSLYRWLEDKSLEFPVPTKISNRLYFDEAQVLAWERDAAITRARKAA